MFQEQAGVYGAIIIDPLRAAAVRYDRDYVVLLSDWTDLDPRRAVRAAEEAPTTTTCTSAPSATSCATCASTAWRARSPTARHVGRDADDARPTSPTSTAIPIPTCQRPPPDGNWTGLFRPARSVRLRFINGAAMTYFDVRIPGLKMTVVAADGQYVHPVDGR
jgi:FtsP/CotA-like multicopper oxidase with cupredoxin domain